MKYAPKNYLLFAVILLVLGFVSPSVSLASSGCGVTVPQTISGVTYTDYILKQATNSDGVCYVFFFNQDTDSVGGFTLDGGAPLRLSGAPTPFDVKFTNSSAVGSPVFYRLYNGNGTVLGDYPGYNGQASVIGFDGSSWYLVENPSTWFIRFKSTRDVVDSGGASVWTSSSQSLVAGTAPARPLNLPHAVPWDDGTTVWNDWLMIKTSSGWGLFYHNSDLSVNSGGYIVADPWLTASHNYFTTGLGGSTWSASTSNHLVASPGLFFDTSLQSVGGPPCKEKLFASHTIFAFGSRSSASYCTDVVPYDVGDELFYRLNLENDNLTFQSSVVRSAPTVLISNSGSSDYVDVPDPISNPGGFVTALLTNLGIWLYNLVIPSSTFFTDSFAQIKTGFDTKFAFYGQIKTAFTVPTASGMTPISLGSLHIGGTTMAPISFISSFDPDDFSGFRNFLSMVLYVGLGFFVIRKMSNIFSS